MKFPCQSHLASSRNLVSPRLGISGHRASLRNEWRRCFAPLKSETTALRFVASRARCAKGLTKFPEIHSALLTAAGVSDKATNHLNDSDKRDAVNGLIENFLEPAGANFVEELVFRFLLTRGDTLGGSMRNVGGFLAQKKLTRSILACLKLAGKKCLWLHSETSTWAEIPENDADVELYLRGICWKSPKGARTLLYNLTVPIVRNNIDLSLFDCDAKNITRNIIKAPSSYIALGELKGGIDPAGADEHWKTARTALNRIHEAFAKQKENPKTFFIGAAIETKMASEIWKMLRAGKLTNAANLTDENQIASISRWLCSL